MWTETLHEYFNLRNSFILIPLAWMTTNVFLAIGFSSIEGRADANLTEKGRDMASMVSTAAITIVTLSFSLTVLSVQIASQSYSPRLLDDFIKDPNSKVVIATNLGAYVYCYVVQMFMNGEEATQSASPVAIHFLTVHFALVMISFVMFIHLFIDDLRIERILKRAAAASVHAARTLAAERAATHCCDEEPDVPLSAYKVLAEKNGYVTHYNFQNLLPRTEKMDIIMRYHRQIGEFVNEGSIICYVWDAETLPDEIAPLGKRILEEIKFDAWSGRLSMRDQIHRKLSHFATQGIGLAELRSSRLDLSLGIQQLSDIAVRALSPGINDPHTAIQCMDILSTLFTELAEMELGVPNVRDKDGNLRLFAPQRSFAHLLSLMDGIRRYGASDLGVCRRGMRMYGELGAFLTRKRRLDRVTPVLAQLEQWMIACRENFKMGSPELDSLKELYDTILKIISQSTNLQLASNESIARGLQDEDVLFHQDSGEAEQALKEEKQKNSILDFLGRLAGSSTRADEPKPLPEP